MEHSSTHESKNTSRNHRQRALSTFGFTLIEVMVALAIAGILTQSIATLMSMMFKELERVQIQSMLLNLRNEALTAVQNSAIWSQTVQLNSGIQGNQSPNLHFINNQNSLGVFPTLQINTGSVQILDTPPPAGYQPGPFNFMSSVIEDSGGTANALTNVYPINFICRDQTCSNPWNSSSLTAGFTRTGQVCPVGSPQFVQPPAVGNDACPFRLAFYWKPICNVPSGICSQPSIEVSTRFQYNPGPGMAARGYRFNFSRYEINRQEIVLSAVNYQIACNSLGGTWTNLVNGIPGGTFRCDFSLRAPCPANQRLLGVNSTGANVCEPILKGVTWRNGEIFESCDNGRKLSGIDTEGKPICSDNIAGADVTDCPDGERVVGINADGTRRCAPQGAETCREKRVAVHIPAVDILLPLVMKPNDYTSSVCDNSYIAVAAMWDSPACNSTANPLSPPPNDHQIIIRGYGTYVDAGTCYGLSAGGYDVYYKMICCQTL